MSQLVLFDDMKIGDRWVSPSKQITRQDAALFAEVTLDFNPLHLDDEFARESPFGRPIAHGLLGLSLVGGLVAESPRTETIALLGSMIGSSCDRSIMGIVSMWSRRFWSWNRPDANAAACSGIAAWSTRAATQFSEDALTH